MERTTLYILSSLVVALVGVVLLMAASADVVMVSIATSLIAGGVASISFATIRYFDDRDTKATATTVARSLADIKGLTLTNSSSLEGLRRNIALSSGSAGRVFDRHPEDEVAALIDETTEGLEIDVMGLTLRPFLRDQLPRLRLRTEATVRLLVQNPSSPTFAQVCDQESRDCRRMVEEAVSVTRDVLNLEGNLSPGVRFEVRWFSELPTVTSTRVGGVIFARPRFLREAHQGRIFYERYVLEDGAPYEIYANNFLAAWDAAHAPTLTECDALSQGDSRKDKAMHRSVIENQQAGLTETN